MNVLVIGSGAREHAICWAIARNNNVSTIFVAPGNGGTALMGGKVRNVPLKATAIDALLHFTEEQQVDLVVVGSEQPLELGIVDRFRAAGKKIVGPVQAAARLESSKVFAKEFMQRHAIPTAGFHVVTDKAAALKILDSPSPVYPLVIKASGLCAGKGVFIVDDAATATAVLEELFDARIFGDAATEVVIEEFLQGQEASLFALTDGRHYRLFLPAQDHKRIGDGDTGKNTGGMGAYAPAPVVTPDVIEKVSARIIAPTLDGMAAEGYPYTGFLYVGLMIHNGEPSVVEFNARLGDPETQVILPLLESDFADILLASLDGTLPSAPFAMRNQSATTVVLASAGYPDHYETGKPVTIAGYPDALLFHAGTTLESGGLVTSGGRVFSVTALGDTLQESIDAAYQGVRAISFEGAQYRTDIGAKGVLA